MSERVRTFEDIEKFLKYEANGFKFKQVDYIENGELIWENYLHSYPTNSYVTIKTIRIIKYYKKVELGIEFKKYSYVKYLKNISNLKFSIILGDVKQFGDTDEPLTYDNIDFSCIREWCYRINDTFVKELCGSILNNELLKEK